MAPTIVAQDLFCAPAPKAVETTFRICDLKDVTVTPMLYQFCFYVFFKGRVHCHPQKWRRWVDGDVYGAAAIAWFGQPHGAGPEGMVHTVDLLSLSFK